MIKNNWKRNILTARTSFSLYLFAASPNGRSKRNTKNLCQKLENGISQELLKNQKSHHQICTPKIFPSWDDKVSPLIKNLQHITLCSINQHNVIWSDIKLKKCLFCFCSDHMFKLLKIPTNAFLKKKKTTKRTNPSFSPINHLDLYIV